MEEKLHPRKKKKTNIVRTRTGCHTCRRRRIKCDERHPACRACVARGFVCEGYDTRYKFTNYGVMQSGQDRGFDTIGWAPPVVQDVASVHQQASPVSTTDPGPHSPDSASALASAFQNHRQHGTGLPSPASQDEKHADSPPVPQPVPESWNETHKASSDGSSNITFIAEDCPDAGAPVTSSSQPSVECTTVAVQSEESPSSPPHRQITVIAPPTCPAIEDLYLDQWNRRVSKLLPQVFTDLTNPIPSSSPLKLAVLAVSAAHLSHVEAMTVTDGKRLIRYVPKHEHRYRALQYYSQGVRQLAKMMPQQWRKELPYVVATSLLFHFFELDSGSFTGVVRHVEAVEKIILPVYDLLKSTRTGRKLLSTWMSTRALVVNRRYSSTLGSCRTPSLNPEDQDTMVSEAGTPYDSIITLLCESLLTARKIVLDWFVSRDRSSQASGKSHPAFHRLLEQAGLPETRRCSKQELDRIDEEYWDTLDHLRQQLDDWHDHLPGSDLPIDPCWRPRTSPNDRFDGVEVLHVGNPSNRDTDLYPGADVLKVEPLRFQSHEIAMNYAYYAMTQLMASKNEYLRMTVIGPFEPLSSPTFSWQKVLLRIAAGLDLSNCVYKNSFNVGMVSLLCLCAAWSPHIEVAYWVEQWMRRLEIHGIALEDGIPLFTLQRILRLAISEKRKQRDIYMLIVPEHGDLETTELYQSDIELLSAVCGKDRTTGAMYNDVYYVP